MFITTILGASFSFYAIFLTDYIYKKSYELTFRRYIWELEGNRTGVTNMSLHFSDYKFLLEQALEKPSPSLVSSLFSDTYYEHQRAGEIIPILPDDIDHACNSEVISFICRRFHVNGIVSHPHKLVSALLETFERFKLFKELSHRDWIPNEVLNHACSQYFTVSLKNNQYQYSHI